MLEKVKVNKAMDIKHDETTGSEKAHETTTKLVCSDHGIIAASKNSSKFIVHANFRRTDDENGMRRMTVQKARRPRQLYVLNRSPPCPTLFTGGTVKVYSAGGGAYELIPPAIPILADGAEFNEKLFSAGYCNPGWAYEGSVGGNVLSRGNGG